MKAHPLMVQHSAGTGGRACPVGRERSDGHRYVQADPASKAPCPGMDMLAKSFRACYHTDLEADVQQQMSSGRLSSCHWMHGNAVQSIDAQVAQARKGFVSQLVELQQPGPMTAPGRSLEQMATTYG